MRLPQRIVLLLVLLPSLSFFSQLTSADAQRSTETTEDRVRGLIQQLGSREYAIRKSAEGELQRLGQFAIDQLVFAQHDESSEIRLAARALLSRLPIRWSDENAPSIVGDITQHFSQLSTREKSLYAGWLVRLEDGVGLKALARIVRYEPTDIVAKQAAIAVIEELDQEDAMQVGAFRTAFDEVLHDSKRVPATWLRRFAADLEVQERPRPGGTVSSWKTLAKQENALEGTPRFDTLVTATLYQKWAEEAFEQQDRAEAMQAVKRLTELRKSSTMLIVETSFWLIDNQQYDIFHELIWNEFDELRKSVPLFAYCEFMVQQKQGNDAMAKKAAESAFNLTESDEEFPHPSERAERAYTRLQTARTLEQEDYIEAAIREYRRLLELESSLQLLSIRQYAASYLSELLHDRRRDREAAEVLQTVIRPGDRPRMDQFEDDSANLSRMYFFWSEHHKQNGDRAKQIQFLNQAINADSGDADVLIAMYRLPRADKKWKARTSKLILDATQSFNGRIQQFRSAGEFENRGDVATYLNQVAWLVSNTEGDFEKAVQQSRRSLELRPGSAGSLDTLGRAYFSVGDRDNAIRYQRRAVRIQPTSHQIVRQLEAFEASKR